MPRKRKLTDLSERCRICLARDSCMSQLFVDWLQPKLEDLQKCTAIEILDRPNYPKHICYVCLYKVEMWNEFKSQFLKTNKTLVTHFKVVDQPVPETEKIFNAESTVDDQLSDDNKKRPKLDIQEKHVRVDLSLIALDLPVRSVVDKPIENEISLIDEVALKSQQSSEGDRKRKLGRPKKIEREAFTKRWVERKNALIAATGEMSTESDSDNSSQLSPVQKARAKSHSDKDLDKQKLKIQKALKNLETNMTDKYRVNQNDIIDAERRTRSQRFNMEDHNASETTKLEVSKAVNNEKKVISSPNINMNAKVDKKGVQEVEKHTERPTGAEEINKSPAVIKETEEQSVDIENVDNETANIKDVEMKLTDDKQPIFVEVKDTLLVTTDVENDIEVVDVDNDSVNGKDDVLKDEQENEPFIPQLVKSEVSVGNTTYVVTTTLDIPKPSSPKSDISLKTNGINIDATNQDGRKIDIMNAVQLKRVRSVEDTALNNENGTSSKPDPQNCLKIEIEGVEVEALQRVQLELANFVKEDVGQRLVNDSSLALQPDSTSLDFKDSYEMLDHQLKSIIEKVLRNNVEADKQSSPVPSGLKRISREFVKAAAKSPVFQPEIVVSRLNVVEAQKNWQINNLHVLENAKRRKGLVGPLSRTLSKRRLVLPKKYDGFAVTLSSGADGTDEESRRRTLKFIQNKPPAKPPVQKVVPEIMISIDKNYADVNPLMEDSSIAVNSTETPKAASPLPPSPKPPTPQPPSPLIRQEPKAVEKPAIVHSKPIKSPTLPVAKMDVKIESLQKPVLAPNRPINQIANNTTAVKTTKVVNKVIPKSTILNSSGVITPKTPKRQRHLCGICGKELFSQEEAETHVKNNHKVESSTQVMTGTPTPPSQKNKPKLMRCKRCQAIVEARHVKTHVCNSIKYNCKLCECSFGAEHLLIAHLETHSHFKSFPTKTSPIKDTRPLADKVREKRRIVNIHDNHDSEVPAQEEDLEEILSGKEPQGYSCFVCDKVFVDEEQMKDHLQMHCEEVSDEGNERGFQCAFCGEKFQTEESLETHVGDHLLEDGDEKIKMMMNLDTRREKRRNIFRCEQCSESFTSSLLLAMHLPLHEEELANTHTVVEEAEHHVCTICDEIFDTPEELSDHQDIHNGNSHVCILCEKPFSSIRDLQEHVSTHL